MMRFRACWDEHDEAEHAHLEWLRELLENTEPPYDPDACDCNTWLPPELEDVPVELFAIAIGDSLLEA